MRRLVLGVKTEMTEKSSKSDVNRDMTLHHQPIRDEYKRHLTNERDGY